MMTNMKQAAMILAGLAVIALGLAERALAQTAKKKPLPIEPVPNSAEALFAKYDTNGDKILDEDELARYVIDTNEMYSKPTFKALYASDPEFRKAVDLEAKKEAKSIAENGIEDPKNPGSYFLRPDRFRNYVETKPKTKKEKF